MYNHLANFIARWFFTQKIHSMDEEFSTFIHIYEIKFFYLRGTYKYWRAIYEF